MNKREDDTMDIEEVIRRLKNMNEDGHLILGDDIAIETAISALERLRLYETNMKSIAEIERAVRVK